MPSETFHVYILKCSDNSYYVGSTSNLNQRLKTHISGHGPQYTASRLPVELVYSELLPDLDSAVKRERQIKKWTRAKKEALIRGDLATLKMLSKKQKTR
ncbi:MAG: GIY-YIG nuclease family protein [Planctomycetes bacterium]|nr:GIY-YIG nuclease family protein [Planctomycetota bacterium]